MGRMRRIVLAFVRLPPPLLAPRRPTLCAPQTRFAATRRRFLGRLGQTSTAAVLVAALAMPQDAHARSESPGTGSEPDGDDVRDDPQLERAMEAFRRGTQAYGEARYEDALAAFQDAATLHASPDFQYNIGLCYEKLDKPDEAIRAFETYLRAKSDAPDRANVEDRITRLRRQIETRDQTTTQPEPTQRPETQPSADGGRPLIIAGGALAGVGAAVALGGGIAFGVLAKRRSDDLDAIQDGGNPQGATFADARDIEREGKRFEALQVTFAAVGAAVAITGIALVAVGAKRRKASATARMHVVPGLTHRSGGLSLVGRF